MTTSTMVERPRSTSWLRSVSVWGPALVVGYLLLGPVVGLVVGAFRTSPFGDSTWTLDGFTTAFSDPRTPAAAWTSVIYAAMVTVLSMVAGVYFAVASCRLNVRLRSWITPAMIVMLVTPRLFFGLGWTMLGNPNSGLLGRGLDAVGLGAISGWFNATSWHGLIFVTALKSTAVVYVLMLGAVSRLDRSHEDAAVMSGVPRFRAFFGITIPLLTPALLATAMLAIVEGLQAYDFPALLGRPVGIQTLSLHIGDYLNRGGQADYSAASALSLFFVICIALLLLVQSAMTRGRDYVTVSSAAHRVEPVSAGRFGPLVTLSIVGFVVVGLVGPVLQVVVGSLQGFFGVYGVWTLRQYVVALSTRGTADTLVSTLLMAVGGGLITVAMAFAIAYVLQRRRGPLSVAARTGSWVPLAAPGIVLSIALVWTYLHTPVVAQLYGTPWLLLSALVVAAVPVAVRALEGVVAQVGPELEEAARTSGASPVAALVDVTARICGPALLVAWLLVGMFMSGILDVPLLLATPGSQTVAVLTFGLATNNGEYAQAAAIYCLYFLLLGLVVVAGVLVAATARRLWRVRPGGGSGDRTPTSHSRKTSTGVDHHEGDSDEAAPRPGDRDELDDRVGRV
ncbi:ABC transporter permease [Pseudonocardia lutea]|uniref:ABC transporter permease n=1 Tax=Pseudonocardia lutea TaxID=2172015 RepID=A0ABW1IHK1_9PSEU